MSILVTIAMILILAVTFLQVLMRFVFHIPIGGFGELPMYMMLIGIWLTAAVNVKKGGHINLDIFKLFVKDEKGRIIVQIITTVITIAAFAILAASFMEFLSYNFRKGAVTPGLSIPYWVIIGIIVFSIALAIFYYVLHLKEYFKELKKWK